MRSYKYDKLRGALLEKASQGDASRLPSERELCGMYGISRTTARRALAQLEKERLVTRHVGRGTYVNPKLRKRMLTVVVVGNSPHLGLFLEREAKAYGQARPELEMKMAQIDQGGLVKAMKEIPGAKILVAPNLGYLASIGLLAPLDKLSGFNECHAKVNTQHLRWTSSFGEPFYYGMPLALNTDVFAFNANYAKELGLDYERGPSDWDSMLLWLEKSASLGGGRHGSALSFPGEGFVPDLQISYYLQASRGKPFLKSGDSGRTSFEFSYGTRWIEFFRRCFETKRVYVENKWEPSHLLDGKILFNFTVSSWLLHQAKGRQGVPFKLCPLPPESPGAPSFSRISSVIMGIVDGGRGGRDDIETGWDFIRHLVSDAGCQRRLVDEFDFLSVNREVFQEQQAEIRWTPFIRSLSTGVCLSDHPAQHGVIKAIRRHFFESVSGKLPVDEAVARINDAAQLLVEVENDRQVG